MQTVKKKIAPALFGSFMFLQFAVLGLGNHAGEGLLSDSRRELVYYGLQVLVILGFLGYAAAERFLKNALRKYFRNGVPAVLAAGSLILALAERMCVYAAL